MTALHAASNSRSINLANRASVHSSFAKSLTTATRRRSQFFREATPVPPNGRRRSGRHKVTFSLRSYDSHMRGKALQFLAVATFVVLAVTFDYFTVAAVYAVGFDGIPLVVLAAACLVLGTVAAYVLTAPVIRIVAKRK